jgi:FtsH-binding integral membrane protein
MTHNAYESDVSRYAPLVESADVLDRVGFIRKTYAHLTGAILAFVLIEALILGVFGESLETPILAMTQGYMWLVVLGAFMGISYVADRWAHSNTSPAMQYLGLAVYVVAEAIIFVPLLYIAEHYFKGTIQSAGIVTAIVFGGLTATVFITKADFSFLRMAISIGMCAALALIVLGIVFGWDSLFGFWFSFAMVILASACVLFSTSNVLHNYHTNQYVAASLALFASVALLFWYVLQLFMNNE